MLGVVGETRYVMGCISQLEDGRYFLEDLSASLPVDLTGAQLAHGYITGAPPSNFPAVSSMQHSERVSTEHKVCRITFVCEQICDTLSTRNDYVRRSMNPTFATQDCHV